jgi:hypothetical protein
VVGSADPPILGDLAEVVDGELGGLLGDLSEELEGSGPPDLVSSAKDLVGPSALAILSGGGIARLGSELGEELELAVAGLRQKAGSVFHVPSWVLSRLEGTTTTSICSIHSIHRTELPPNLRRNYPEPSP